MTIKDLPIFSMAHFPKNRNFRPWPAKIDHYILDTTAFEILANMKVCDLDIISTVAPGLDNVSESWVRFLSRSFGELLKVHFVRTKVLIKITLMI